MIRAMTMRLRMYVKERRRVLRREARFEAHLPFIVTLLGTAKDPEKSLPDAPALVGYTRDLSETGLTLLLPSVRIGDGYLTDMESYLGVKLQIPGGAVAMLTVSVRFEQLSQKEAGCGYLLAVRIVKMQDEERERYNGYLTSTASKKRRTRERRQAESNARNQNSKAQSGTWEALTPASVSQAFEQFLQEQDIPRAINSGKLSQ